MRKKVLHLVVLLSCSALTYGQYQIGHTTVNFKDNSRGGRAIPTEIYYPANVMGDNVPVAAPLGELYPVVSFGHGFVITWANYDWLWEALVPQGYILAFPRTEGQLLPAPDHQAFGEDLVFVAKRIVQLGSKPGSPVYNKLTGTTAIAGHSMGGGATYLGAAGEPGVTTTITWASAETSPSGIAAAASVSQPSLVIAAEEDCVSPESSNQLPMYNALAADCKAYVSIDNATHCNFTNGGATLCYLGEGPLCLFSGPFISRNEQHNRTLAVMEPWLEAQLLSNCASWTDFENALVSGNLAGDWTYQLGCTGSDLGCLRSSAPDGNSFNLYPNPATDFVIIPEAVREVKVIDQHGRLVAAGTGDKISVRNLESGLYIFECAFDEKIERVLIVVSE